MNAERAGITYKKIVDGASGDLIASPVYVRDFKIIVVAISGASSPDFAVRFLGSICQDKDQVDFEQPAGPDNQHDQVGLYKYRTADFVDGDTGLVFSGTEDTFLCEVNVSGLNWISAEVFNHNAGEATVTISAFSNA